MRVLGIETSCDETGVAIYDESEGLLADALYSQIDLHREYGGVVPELASRDHLRKLLPMIKALMQKTNTTPAALDGIAYTAGPGLVGALMVGGMLARSLAYAWRLPAVGVHHMEGHLLSPFLQADTTLRFPLLALLVSGGHTQLVKAQSWGNYQLLGDTLDDAAGEAFDKVAKMLDLGYPGGPEVARLAQRGDRKRFDFPLPMVNRPTLDFSFSGIKTFTRNLIEQLQHDGTFDEQARADVAAGFEWAVARTLGFKCRRAVRQTGIKRLLIAGGVSANKTLRAHLTTVLDKEGAELFDAPLQYCTDNGAMIAYAGCLRLRQLAGDSEQQSLSPQFRSRWPLDTLSAEV